jgi:hypothetical protein
LEHLLVRLDAVARLENLPFAFEQEGPHLALGQAAAQVEEGAVFFALAAMAIGAAAFEETFQEGGVDEIRGQLAGLEQAGLALAQSQGGKGRLRRRSSV